MGAIFSHNGLVIPFWLIVSICVLNLASKGLILRHTKARRLHCELWPFTLNGHSRTVLSPGFEPGSLNLKVEHATTSAKETWQQINYLFHNWQIYHIKIYHIINPTNALQHVCIYVWISLRYKAQYIIFFLMVCFYKHADSSQTSKMVSSKD